MERDRLDAMDFPLHRLERQEKDYLRDLIISAHEFKCKGQPVSHGVSGQGRHQLSFEVPQFEVDQVGQLRHNNKACIISHKR